MCYLANLCIVRCFSTTKTNSFRATLSSSEGMVKIHAIMSYFSAWEFLASELEKKPLQVMK